MRQVNRGDKKDRILVSAFPAQNAEQIKPVLNDMIEECEFVSNVLATAVKIYLIRFLQEN